MQSIRQLLSGDTKIKFAQSFILKYLHAAAAMSTLQLQLLTDLLVKNGAGSLLRGAALCFILYVMSSLNEYNAH